MTDYLRKYIKAILFSASVLMFISLPALGTVTIYRWVDKDSIVHFSQQQPATNIEYTELVMKNNKSSSQNNKTPEISTKANKLADNFEQDNLAKCDNAKSNILKLKQFEKIQSTDQNGESKVLSEIEKLQQIRLAEKQIDTFCK